METSSGWQILREQVETILLFLQRPIISRQLVAMLAIVFTAWLCSTIVWHVLGKQLTLWAEDRLKKRTKYWRYLVVFMREAGFPLFAMLSLLLVRSFFSSQNQDSNLLLAWGIFFWFFLAYRVLIAALYIALGQRMKGYQVYFAAPLFWFVMLLVLFGSLIDFGAVGQIQLFTFFDYPILLGKLFTATATLYFLFSGAWVAQDLIKYVLVPRTNADPGVVNAGLTISSYVVAGIGFLIVFDTFGLNASSLAFVGGGLSIGIGFGLQEILANFISGIILLFERSLKPGDVISIKSGIGTVEAVDIRSTTIRTLDNVQVIVPNETFLTNPLTNYTHHNPIVRILIPVRASYNSDPQNVFKALLNAAERYEKILKDPAPSIFFSGFGDHHLEFKLAVWVNKPAAIPRLSSELRLLIWEEFAKHDLEMPFPQQDIHIRSGIPWEKFGTVEVKEV